VVNVEDPPTVSSIPTLTVTEEVPETIDLSSYIFDEDTPRGELVVTLEDREDGTGPTEVTIEGLRVTLLYMAWVEDHALPFEVYDGTTRVGFDVSVRVVPVNDPPRILMVGRFGPPFDIECNEGSTPMLTIVVEDEDSEFLSYFIASAWEGVSVLSNGTLQVRPPEYQIGRWWANLTVDDSDGGIETRQISIAVLNVNDPPGVPGSLSPPTGTFYRTGETITFSARVSDPDMRHGVPLTVTWTSDLDGELHTVDTLTGDVSFETSDLRKGTHRITVAVSDGEFERSAWVLMRVEGTASTGPGSFITSPGGIVLVCAIIVAISVAVVFVLNQRREGEG
jgi:hypothetical protein